ncbi:glycosyltransferase family 4 protein [Gephyromycinifex aptenodytis]|uniref:glycosyltransferase family 4 protein n=1 Tax=Gephyromycinifex aptenodytis TaxID=2716227 RepID=UPI0014459C89|nr:glycosyltransferase family 4 protein [Gephyromycinifex aptenodytis]
MKVAIKFGSFSGGPAVDAQGRLVGHEAVTTLARRLLRVFPGASIVGPAARRCDGFDMVPLEFIDAADTLVINMDVIDSLAVWQTLHSSGAEPKLMNFAWQNPSHFHHRINFAAMGLSFALFPTFCNSERTAGEVCEVIEQWVTAPLANASRVAWVNLGVDIEHVQPRSEPEVPVVLYPAIYVSERKQPRAFLEVVERVAKKTPVRVEARLHESHLVSEFAMKLSRRKWAWVGPLTATKEGYWQALAGTTAFLATAREESYGLEYVEAMLAGVIGVFPDAPWVHTILPERYPFVYSSPAQAEEMLLRALTETERCRHELDLCVGGDFTAWIKAAHNDDDFERAVVARVHTWFGS